MLVLFCGLVALSVVRNSELKRNGIMLSGVITSYGYPAKSSIANFTYKFYHNGKEHIASNSVNVRNPRQFVGKRFPLKFSKSTKKSQILIRPRDFEAYGLNYPDSLAWVREYVIN